MTAQLWEKALVGCTALLANQIDSNVIERAYQESHLTSCLLAPLQPNAVYSMQRSKNQRQIYFAALWYNWYFTLSSFSISNNISLSVKKTDDFFVNLTPIRIWVLSLTDPAIVDAKLQGQKACNNIFLNQLSRNIYLIPISFMSYALKEPIYIVDIVF